MNFLKNKVTARFVIFFIITMMVFWLIPGNIIFGEGESGTPPGSEQPVTTDTTITTDTAPETTTTTETTQPPDTTTTDTAPETTQPPDTTTTGTTELVDITPPVITLNGGSPVIAAVGSIYRDTGATALDDVDGDITSSIAVVNTVGATTAGSYTVTYNVSDAAGNPAIEVVRTVNVVSQPTIFTDKLDYLPDDYVLVTGSGWLPGETIKLDFHETLIDLFQQTITYYTFADSEGKITDIQYLIALRHLGASFILTATGLTSRLTAQTTFTDAAAHNVNFATSGLPSGVSLTIIYSCTNNGGNPVNNASVTFTSPGPSAKAGTKAGTSFTYSGFPSSVTVDGSTYNLTSTSPTSPFTTGVAGGDTTVIATYDIAGTHPSITVQPVGAVRTVGQSYTFSVTATGTAPLSYQWRKGGEDISGGTGISYTIDPIALSDAGSYDVVVTNLYGSVTSTAATLTVNKVTPTITWANPAAITYGTALGATQLNATASAPGSFVYIPVAGTVLNAGAGQNLRVDFTPTDTANYNSTTKTVQINVTQKSITVIPDAGQAKVYGQDDPVFTYTALALEAGDSLSGALDRAAGDTAGTYAFNLGTLANPSYSISLADPAETFAITQKVIKPTILPVVTIPPVITDQSVWPDVIEVLGFTGLDPVKLISGGFAVIAVLAMLLATLRRRVNRK